MSAAVVDLLLQVTKMPDPNDVNTWSVRGRRPTVDELALLESMSTQDIDDWETLVHLAGELKRGAS